MKNLHLSKISNIFAKCTYVTLMLFISLIVTSVDAKIKDRGNKTTVLTSVAANTEYNFSGDVKLNKVTLDNTILNIADGKTLKLNNDVFVKGENSAINAPTIELGPKTLTVFDGSKLTMSGSVSKGNGGGINLGNSGILGVESGKILKLNDITLSSGIVDLAGKIIGNLKETTLNLTDKNADFSDVAFDNVSFHVSAEDYDINEHIEDLLSISGITNIDLNNDTSLNVTSLNTNNVSLSGGVINLAGTIAGKLENITLNITNPDVDFSGATFENVNFKVSDKDYNFYSLLNEQNVMREGITTLTLADENFEASDMETISQRFSGKVDNLSFEKGTYNIKKADNEEHKVISFNSDTLSLAGAHVNIINADLENSNDFSITGGVLKAISETRDNEIEARNGLLSISGGDIEADGFEFSGHNGVEISGGTLVLSNDSEISSNLHANMEASGIKPYLTISGGDITLNRSHLLSRSDIDVKGIINMTGGNLTVNEGFIGAFNYSDGGIGEYHASEGGQINISGGTITFNGGNSIYDQIDWVGDDETGNFIANEILAQNINVSGDAQINISKDANLKTTALTRTNGDSIDFSDGASFIKLSDNSSLNLSGAIRANIDKDTETAGTLNINDSDARIVGNVSGVNMAINSEFDLDNIEGNIGRLGNLDITEGGLTISGGKKIVVDNLTVSGGESYLKGEGLQTSEIQVNGAANIIDGIFEIDSLVGLVSKGSGDINIWGGQVIGENSWNTPEEIQDDDTRMGNNIRHDGNGNINISGGEVNFKDHASIVARNGNINISGGKVILTSGAEIWSANEEAKTVISGDADITITSGADITPEGTLEIKGGKIDVTDGEVAGITAFNMTGGTLNLNNSMFGAEGPEVEQGNDSIHEDGQVMISGGTINVAGIPSIATHGTITENDHVNVLSGGDITMNGGVMNIQNGAFLSVRNGFDDETYGDLSTINFTKGIINLNGTIEGNLLGSASLGSGLLNIEDSNAKIVGNVSGVNLAINSDFATKDHWNGIANDLGDVTLAEGKTLELILNEGLTGDDEDLNVKGFTMGKDSILKITTSDYTKDMNRDFKSHGPVQVTGIIDIDHGGLKLDSGNTVADFNMENVNATAYDGDFVARSNGGDMNIKNSDMNIEYAVIEKVYNGNLNIMDGSTITLSQKNGEGAIISKADTNSGNPNFIPQNPTGDINISASIINMNANSAILRGDSEFDIVDDQLVFDEGIQAKGNGSINIDNSIINMNDHSIIAMNNLDPTKGTVNIKNGSILNVNGDNKILTSADIEVENSAININQDSTLSLQGKSVRPEDGGVIHLGQGSVLNLFGTLDGNLVGDQNDARRSGTLNIMSEDADITGIAHWLNIGLEANSTFMGEDIFIHNLTVGNDEQKAVQLTIDGDEDDEDRAWGSIDSLMVKDGATVLAKTTTAEWEQTGELDSPIRHNVALDISKIQVDQGATLELNGNGNHSVDVFGVKTASINGTLNLVNGRLEGSDEDPNSSMTIDGADIHMSGTSNIETGGAITINNSSVNMDIDDHGFVSSTSLDIQGSTITLSDSKPAELGNGHLIAYKGFDDVSGDLNIQNGSIINMNGSDLLSGENVNIADSSLNIKGNGYIISHQNEINLDNSALSIEKGKTLSVLTGKDLGEIDDENYPTIVEAYQALNPNKGTLNLHNESVLNLAGTINGRIISSDSSGTLYINDAGAKVNGNVNVPNLVFNSDYTWTTSNLSTPTSLNSITVGSTADVILQDAPVLNVNTLILDGGNFTRSNTNYSQYLYVENDLDINSGKFQILNTEIYTKHNGKIAISGGEVNLNRSWLVSWSDEPDAMTVTGGNINLRSADLIGDRGLWISGDDTYITLYDNSRLRSEEYLRIDGGHITLHGSRIDNSYGGAERIELNNGEITVVDGNNEINGSYIDVNGGTLNINEDATLNVLYGRNKVSSAIKFSGGDINLEGTLNGNLMAGETTGTLNINNSRAELNGYIKDIDVAIHDNYSFINKGLARNSIELSNGEIINLSTDPAPSESDLRYMYDTNEDGQPDRLLSDAGIFKDFYEWYRDCDDCFPFSEEERDDFESFKLSWKNYLDDKELYERAQFSINTLTISDGKELLVENSYIPVKEVNLYGGTLTVSDDSEIKGLVNLNINAADARVNGNINVSNLVFNSDYIWTTENLSTPTSLNSITVNDSGNVVLQDSPISNVNTLIIDGGSFTKKNKQQWGTTLYVTNDLNINSGKLQVENGEIYTKHSGKIAISGGEINLIRSWLVSWSDEPDAMTVTGGNINLRSADLIGDRGLWISGDDTYITLYDNSRLRSEQYLKVDGGHITLHGSRIENAYTPFQPGGRVELNNGEITVADGRNEINAAYIDINGGTLNINEDATLDVLYDENKFSSAIKFSGGDINLEGTLNGNLMAGETTGTLNINNSRAELNGYIKDIDVAIHDNYSFINKGLARNSIRFSNGEIIDWSMPAPSESDSRYMYDTNGDGQPDRLLLDADQIFKDFYELYRDCHDCFPEEEQDDFESFKLSWTNYLADRELYEHGMSRDSIQLTNGEIINLSTDPAPSESDLRYMYDTNEDGQPDRLLSDAGIFKDFYEWYRDCDDCFPFSEEERDDFESFKLSWKNYLDDKELYEQAQFSINTLTISDGKELLVENSYIPVKEVNLYGGTLTVSNDSEIKGGVNLSGGAVNLAGKIDSLNATAGTLNVTSRGAVINGTTTLSNSSVLNLGTNKLTTDTLNINPGATVNFTVASANNYGSIKANEASINPENTTLNLTLNSGVVSYDDATGITVQLIDANIYNGSFGMLNEVNNRYGFRDLGNGSYQIYGLGNSAASIVADAGGNSDTQDAATAWLDSNHLGLDIEVGIENQLENLAQVNAPALVGALEALQPEAASVRVEATTSNNLQIANATTTRLNSLVASEAVGRAGGDIALQSNLWVQGLHNKSKLDTANGFSGKTYGIAMGFDVKPMDDTIVGIGYAYTQTDLDAVQKTTDIESHTAMLYGQQTVGNAFVNAIVTYGFNQYDESRSASGISDSSKYNMDSVFSQVMTGYNFNLDVLKITPKAGLRYLWTHVHDYTDSANQHVQSENTNTMTGVIGTTIASDFKTQGLTLTPKFSLAGTYDVKQDGGNSTVTLSNGANYTTRGDTLKRFGIETGVGLNMSYENLEFGIQYEGRFKKDYKDHTGLMNFRYNF